MGWEDRHYYRDPSSSTGSRLLWLINGSVPLGTWFGISVRVHASMILLVGLTLIFPTWLGGPVNAVIFGSVLFAIILLHEFGHCFASRWVGGDPREIVLSPLGGLAFADAPRRPWATFITVVGGPAVNVLICALTGAALVLMGYPLLPWNLLNLHTSLIPANELAFTALWFVFTISWALLLFNLLPIFPLDGGQMLQSLLWVRYGYYRATVFACITGMIGAVVLAMLGLAKGELLLVLIALSGFLTCFQLRHQLKAAGPWGFEDEDNDYSASFEPAPKVHRKHLSRWAIRRARKILAQEHAEQERIDIILAKVSARGMHSLTWRERRALRQATERQRQADLEFSRGRDA